MATELAALNVRITGDTADIQADLAKTEAGLTRVGSKAATATKSTKGFTGGLSKLSNVSGQTRAKIQNTSFQLQDIAVQLQGGTKASTALAQQLPQLLGGFGALGAVLGVVAGVGIPAVAFAFSSLRQESLWLTDALDILNEAVDNYAGASRKATMSTAELNDRFTAGEDSLRSVYRLLEQIASSEAQTAIDNTAQSISDLMGVRGAGESRTGIAKFFDINIMLAFTREQKKARKEARLLSQEFLNGQIALQNAKGDLDAQIIATKRLLAVSQALALLKDGESEKERQLKKDLAEALALMLEQQRALEASARAAREINEQMSSIVTAGPMLQIPESGFELLMPPNQDTTKKKRGSTVDPLPGELERLQKSLMSKEELQIASFNRQQETLKNALNQELLTRQEYNLLMEDAEMQHSERMAGIAVFKHGDTLQQTQAFMGGMASALSSGNEKMMKAARVFGAAEALINAFRAYNQVIADPTLPFFAKIPAALSVLGAGIGMVNSIKGVSGGGGGAGAASAASGAAGQASRPMEARISGLDPNSLFTGASITSLFDALQDEAGDRGLSVSFG